MSVPQGSPATAAAPTTPTEKEAKTPDGVEKQVSFRVAVPKEDSTIPKQNSKSRLDERDEGRAFKQHVRGVSLLSEIDPAAVQELAKHGDVKSFVFDGKVFRPATGDVKASVMIVQDVEPHRRASLHLNADGMLPH